MFISVFKEEMVHFKKIRLSIIITILLFLGCLGDDAFDLPPIAFDNVELPTNTIDIDAVIGLYNQAEDIYTFTDEEDYLEGYVISDDSGGNFFKQLIIQDKAENPTAGIAVEIDLNPLFTKYPFGSRILIKLKGLSIGLDNGVYTLGRRELNRISRISSSLLDKTIIRTSEFVEIIPKKVNMTQFSDELENLYIELRDVQFSEHEIDPENPKTFAAEDTDQFNGERLLISCTYNKSVILSTSTFSDFKSLKLPSGRGSLRGVLSRDFFDDFYTIFLNSPEDISFDNEDRCDTDSIHTETLNCGEENFMGNLIYFEDFDSYSNIPAMESAGWINRNIVNGSTRYTIGSFDGNKYAQISGFNSEEFLIDSWLISPPIAINPNNKTSIQFDVQASFSTGKHLDILIASNYTDNIFETDWHVLDNHSIPTGPSSGFGSMVSINAIDITCLSAEEIRLAFRYQGSDPVATTRYHIDNVRVYEDIP